MRKTFKILLISILALIVLGIVGIFVSDSILNSKIENILQNKLPETLNITYDNIEVSTLNGRLTIISPKVTNFGQTTGKINSQLEMDSLVIDDLDYWDYFFDDKIRIKSIQFKRPRLKYFHTTGIDKKEYKYSKLEQLKQNITINQLRVYKGEMEIFDSESDSLLLKTSNFTSNITDIHLDNNTVKRRIPFDFKSYEVSFDNLFYQLSNYENMEIQSSRITNKKSSFDQIKLYTKYSKSELTKIIKVERDHFDVTMSSFVMENQKFGYRQDSVFYFSSPKLVFSQPEMIIYRNKLVADDNTVKPLYSKMLRNLGFDLTLDEIEIEDAKITYAEKVKVGDQVGEVHFSNLNANIKNISNTYSKSEKTSIAIKARFMELAPLEIQWEFDVNQTNDHFTFRTELGNLNASKLNSFTEPGMNIRLEGDIKKTFFTIDGYDNESTVDMKLNYEDFKVIVLQKDEKKKNKLLSAVANIFIRKDSEKLPENFRNGAAVVERNKTKSIFNFIWLNASQAMLKAMTGNGKDK